MHFLNTRVMLLAGLLGACNPASRKEEPTTRDTLPNIVLIYADDLGYGDVSCYGAKEIQTPHIDRLAASGLLFTRAYATSATCTPSRYSMLTGEYAWRKPGRGIAPGDAALLIDTGIATLPSVLQDAGYTSGVIGKWHLGLGPEGGPDWNGDIKPGPLEVGFDYSFLVPATGDRVPCVYVENYRVVGLDPGDPIQVSFDEPVGDWPTGKEHPELLKMHPSHGHDMTIIDSISRIGYMTGGKSALWKDADMAGQLVEKSAGFMEDHQDEPFFLFFSTHDIHVPRVPHSRFAGKSGMGPRGDAILQLDWCVGQLMETLERLELSENTLVIFTSDNGPVLDDGDQDGAVEKLGGHTPAGPLRGGKYSAFDAGTRVPFIVNWPGKVQAGESDAPVSQVDLLASFAAFTGQKDTPAPDSRDAMDVLLGKSDQGREYIVEQSAGNTLSLIKGDWKYIEPSDGPKVNQRVNIELGNDPDPQLYNLKDDPGETQNLAQDHPDIITELAALLEEIKG